MKVYQEIKSNKKLNISKFFEIKSIIIYVLSIIMGALKLPSGATPFGVAMIGAMADTGFPLVTPMVIIGITTGIAFGWMCLIKFIIAYFRK